MERTDEAFLVRANLVVHHRGSARLLVKVQGQMLPGLVYTPFHHGSNGFRRRVQQDTIGVVEDTD